MKRSGDFMRPNHMRKVLALAATLMLLTAVSGCSSDRSKPLTNSTPDQTSSAAGRPVVVSGRLLSALHLPPTGVEPRPEPGSVAFKGPSNVRVVVGRDGAFFVSLKPGRYVVIGKSSYPLTNKKPSHCSGRQTLTVLAGADQTIRVICRGGR